ncbi:MAG TPA: GDSL-type esterase/lipase family protein [Chloroflexia bacterium]|nr:GDSL-type esterase/lipase family protein [Chloroflexia bacterium]
MFDSLRYDRTARSLLLGGLGLLVLVGLLGIFSVVSRPPPPVPTPTPTATPTYTPLPTWTAPPVAVDTVPPLDTAVASDTAVPPGPGAAPTDTPAGAAPPGPGATPYLTPLPRPIIYSAMGASDTVGVGAANPDRDAWPVVLASRLPADTQFHRFGIGGIVLGQALEQELPQTIASKPTLVTVWLAANDLTKQVPLPTYQQQLDTLLQRLTTQTTAQIVLLNLPDLSLVLSPSLVPGGKDAIRSQVLSWDVAIGATAATYGNRVLLVDLFPQSGLVTSDSTVLSGDNWHPSTKGYKVIGDYVYDQIQQAGLLAGP